MGGRGPTLPAKPSAATCGRSGKTTAALDTSPRHHLAMPSWLAHQLASLLPRGRLPSAVADVCAAGNRRPPSRAACLLLGELPQNASQSVWVSCGNPSRVFGPGPPPCPPVERSPPLPAGTLDAPLWATPWPLLFPADDERLAALAEAARVAPTWGSSARVPRIGGQGVRMENCAYAVPAGRSDGSEGMGGATAPGSVRTDPPASAAATSTTGGDDADGGESGGGDNSRRGDGRLGAAGMDASLFAAAAAGDTEQVEALLNVGAWSLVELPIAGGGCPRTPLMAAAAAGHQEAVAFLVQVLASTVVALSASDGETALTLALRGGHTGVAETILGPAEDLEDCPPVNVAGADGTTPLLVAAATGADTVVKQLLVLKSRGGEGMTSPANVWAVTGAGESAMHLAVNGGHTGALKELVRSDAFDAAL